jgi:hypothetical protein
MKIMKIKYTLLIVISALFVDSCFPEKLEIAPQDVFAVKNMDPDEFPMVTVNKRTGGSKTFVIFASHATDSIARIQISDKSHDFVMDPVACKMVDKQKPVDVDSLGFLSRKLSTVVFTCKLTIPGDFQEGIFSVKFTIYSGKGDTSSIICKCKVMDYFNGQGRINIYNGQTKSGTRTYSGTAPCFLDIEYLTSYKYDYSFDPPKSVKYIAGCSIYGRNASQAVSETYRKYIHGYIYTDLADFDQRKVYIVSPNTSWIGDSLRILNKLTITYPYEQMYDIKYVDLGPIDFIHMSNSTFENIPFETEGQSMIQLMKGHCYAFYPYMSYYKAGERKVGIIYVKEITYYDPSYTVASPTATVLVAVQKPDNEDAY